ncbi:DMT family transporter [Rhodobacteraceae bacterium HSP-20]|uniref:DMT family transporter n=1 Tax=Paragemmobacter amnigenus TaxID=2852097 RepID=A0ABS6J1M9_9RHOB|nr:DMT family transporter [Rhodobacter amnigenus]MBU9697648.1 DMT family transporter [Rhodobacter amnigenus]MBV4388875.1 DMT family transporter [Rhodobacter amnigenus]
MTVSSNNIQGAVLSLAAFGIYATHDVVVKYLGSSYSAVQIIFFSGLLSFPLVTVMLLGDRRDENLVPRHPWWSLARAVSAVLTGVAGFFAFSRLPMAQAYAIFFAMPLLITLMAIPLLGERVGARRGLAVVVGLLGVLVVLRPGEAELGLGHLAALSAAVTGALTSVIVRKIGGNERSAVLMLYPMLANVLAMGAALPFVYVPMPVSHLGLMCIIALFSFIAGLLVIKAYRTAPAVIVAPMQYSQILWAAVFGTLFFDESIDLGTAIGSAIIIASGIYIVLREGTPSVSGNRPVLSTKSRPETGSTPRVSVMMQRMGIPERQD